MNNFIKKVILKFVRLVIEASLFLLVVLYNIIRVILCNLTVLYLYVPYILVALILSIIPLGLVSILTDMDGSEVIKLILEAVWTYLLGVGVYLIILHIICIPTMYIGLHCSEWANTFVNECIHDIENKGGKKSDE